MKAAGKRLAGGRMGRTGTARQNADELALFRTCKHCELPFLMTPEEAAVRARVGYEVFLRWIRQGKVPARKVGGRYRIQRDFFA